MGILGLGRSGRAAAELALSRGAAVYASDAGESPELRAAAAAVRESGGVAEVGAHDVERLAACDLIVVSPGIPPDAAVLREPRLVHVRRVPELEYAFGHLSAPVIAVTGTNGKTTTTSLISQLLESAGLDAPAAGNIGYALSGLAMRRPPPDWAVVEASSFQLGGIETFAPRIGAVTNLSPDHLDRYPSVAAYYADKANLFRNATTESRWVLNGEDEAVLALPGDAPGRRYVVRVRTSAAPDELGAFLRHGDMVVRLESGEWVLGRADALPLLGEHNRFNALAAALAAILAGAEPEAVGAGLRCVRPLEHRLEPVAERGGVLWVNDSKATNIESTRMALRSLSRPIVLLLGGRHKGEPYTSLLPELGGRVRAVVAYGEAAGQVVADLAERVPVVSVSDGFEAVVQRAAELARPGDIVLLSPACASYDMFRDYEERGRRFRELAGDA